MTIAYVGLGSNLGDRERMIREAAALIGAVRISTLIETEPWGYGDQPMFLNAVAELETPLTARQLLDHLLDVERRLDELIAIGRPVLIGFSRKSSLARILGDTESKVGTMAASVGAALAAFDRGATILRAHHVSAHVEALAAAKAVRG